MYRAAMRVPASAIREYVDSLELDPPEGLPAAGVEASDEQRHTVARRVVSHFVDDDAAAAAEQAYRAEHQ